MKKYIEEWYVTGGITIEVEAENEEQAHDLISEKISQLDLGVLENEDWVFERFEEVDVNE